MMTVLKLRVVKAVANICSTFLGLRVPARGRGRISYDTRRVIYARSSRRAGDSAPVSGRKVDKGS
jgi:hypothetical protein